MSERESEAIMTRRKSRRSEAGSSMAEFAVVAALFFMVLIGIIEFGRFFYTHNALTDAARRGARYAALHPEAARPCVKNIVAYGETHVDPTTCEPTGPPLINGLGPTDVTVTYAGTGTNPFGMNLGSVTVTIQYSFTIRLPLFSRTIELPTYSTTLPAESAGTKPADI